MVDGFRAAIISLNEIAKQLRVHSSTLHRWTRTGVRGRRLPSVLVGGRRYVRISDLEAFLQDAPPDAPVSDDRRNRAAQQRLASFGLLPKHRRGMPESD